MNERAEKEASQTGASEIVRTGQVVVGAMFLGVVSALVVITVVVAYNGPMLKPGDVPVVTLAAAAVAIAALTARLILPPRLVAMEREKIVHIATPADTGTSSDTREADDRTRLLQLYQKRLMVSAVLLEGAAIVAVFAYLLEGNASTLLIAGALAVFLALHVPRRERVEAWLNQQTQLIDVERSQHL